MNPAQLQALVAEAMKRTALVWLSYAGSDRAWPVWHVWHEGAAYVVCGGAEQPLPGIENVAQVAVDADRAHARHVDARTREPGW